MDLGISGKIAVIAGSSRGLGRAVAYALAQEGCHVVLNGRHDDVEQCTKEIKAAFGVKALAVQSDVATEQGCRQLIDEAVKSFGTVHILVTNAGGPKPGGFADMTDEDWLSASQLTLLNPIRLIRLVLPHMKKNQWGRIVNMTSLSVKQPIENLILSNSLRAAVTGMSKTIANEVGMQNILINNVAPGVFLTERTENLIQSLMKKKSFSREKILEDMEQASSLRRLGKPHEFADVVAFLCSEKASYVTGSTMLVDGGAYKGI